jgi:galactokinase
MIGQYAENYYFGKPCGLMDQMACSVGSLCHIDFADPTEPKIERIELDMDAAGYSLCITDTKGSHADLTPDYAAVPAEMKSVAAYFGKEVLNDISEEEVIRSIPELRERLGDRAVLRAMHYYEENKRVENESEALKSGDMMTFLKNVKASGNSSYKFLQNVFTTRDIQHQNVSVALCISEKVLGEDGGVARVHGGGFAGTIQAFVRNEKVGEYKAALDQIFGEGSCAVLKIRKYGGIRII